MTHLPDRKFQLGICSPTRNQFGKRSCMDIPGRDDLDFDALTELNSLVRAVANVLEVFMTTQPPPQHLLETAWEILTNEFQQLQQAQQDCYQLRCIAGEHEPLPFRCPRCEQLAQRKR